MLGQFIRFVSFGDNVSLSKFCTTKFYASDRNNNFYENTFNIDSEQLHVAC